MAGTPAVSRVLSRPASRAWHETAGVTRKEALDHYREPVLCSPPDGYKRVLALAAEVRRLRARQARPAR